MATAQFSFTERTLDGWVQDTLTGWQEDPSSVPLTGETWAQDRGGPKSVPGLHLRLRLRRDGAGGWSLKEPLVVFYLMKKVQGRKFARELGDRRVTSVQSARDAATDLLKSLVKGEDPKETERREKEVLELQKLTFRSALEAFLADSPALAKKTHKKYRESLSTTFKDVADKPLPYFTEERVRDLHHQRSQESRARADQDFRVLRLIWNWARDSQRTEDGTEVLGPNPVSLALNKRNRRAGKRGWNNVPRKERTIPRAKLPDWFGALRAIHQDPESTRVHRTGCLLLEALALTGLRFNELAELPWARIDPDQGILTVPDTSSKNRRALVRPLTRRVREILEGLRPEDPAPDAYIFPGRKSGTPIKDTRALQVDLRARTGLWITPHDLRRVYSSAATRAGVPPLTLKRLLNHQGAEGVTEGYVRPGLDELLDVSQDAEDQILRDAGLLGGGDKDKLLVALKGLSPTEREELLAQLAGGTQA